MKADLTRESFNPLKHFSRVLMQQGRVQLDADWNEQADILLRYLRQLGTDIIGPHGGPKDNFQIKKLDLNTNSQDFENSDPLRREAVTLCFQLSNQSVYSLLRSWHSAFP